MANASSKTNALIKVGGIAFGVVLITVGMIAAPKLGNYSVIIVAAGVSVAVVAFVSASLRGGNS